MMRKVLTLIALMSVFSSCNTAEDSAACASAANRDSDVLVVEGDPWSGYAPFRPNGQLLPGRLEYREELDQAKRACDLSSGAADFIVTTVGQFLANKPDGVIVGVIDQSQGADALVLNTRAYPYLKSVDWLPKLIADRAKDGTKPVLAYTGKSPSEELLNELSNTFEDFKPSDFELVSVDQSATALTMLNENKAQLAILWEPDVATARAAGDVVAYSSRDVPNSIVDVIVASRRIIRENPAAVQDLIDAYYSFIDAVVGDHQRVTDFIARDAKMKVDEAASVLSGMRLYGSADANTFMNVNVAPLDEPQLRSSVKAIGSLLALQDPALVVTDEMVDGSFVAKAPRR